MDWTMENNSEIELRLQCTKYCQISVWLQYELSILNAIALVPEVNILNNIYIKQVKKNNVN